MNLQSEDLLRFVTPSIFDYDKTKTEATITGLFIDGRQVDELLEEGVVVCDNTVFYAESGGQIADRGVIENDTARLEVIDVQKAPNGQHMHFVKVAFGSVRVGERMNLEIDEEKRFLTMRNHSSLHLLQRALIEVLGTHILQQGSYVADEYGRFDFTNSSRVTEEQLLRIEALVNRYIEQNAPRQVEVLPIEEAKRTGAISPFDEKYGALVRIVTFGSISKEFCGGTHVPSTGIIGTFAIESEMSIAAGIRRIVTRTGNRAYELLKQREKLFMKVRDQLGASSIHEVPDRLKALLSEKEQAEIKIGALVQKQARSAALGLAGSFITAGTSHVLAAIVDEERDMLVKIADELKSEHSESVFLLLGGKKEETPLVVYVGPLAQKRGLKAGTIVKAVATIMDGSGGGRPDIAFGAGKRKDKVDEAIKAFKELVK